MARNFGFSNVTNRLASSGAQQPQAGSHSRAGQRDSKSVRALLSSPDDREFAAFVLFFVLVGCPLIFVGAVYLLLT